MNTIRISTFFVLSLLLMGTTCAEEPYEKWLQYFAGTWEFTGDGVKGSVTYRKQADGECLLGTGRERGDDGDVSFVSVIGWDSANKMIVDTYYDSSGRCGRNEYTSIGEEKVAGTRTGTDSSGNRLPKARIIVVRDGATVIATYTLPNGETQTWVYRRAKRKSEAKQSDGQQVFEEWADLAVGGVWSRKTDDGEKVEHRYRRVAKGRFVLFTAKGGMFPGRSMIGVDPKTGRATWWDFNEDGSVGKSVMTQEAPGVWKLNGRFAGLDGDSKWSLVARKAGKNRIRTEKFLFDGEKQGDQVWTRSPQPRR